MDLDSYLKENFDEILDNSDKYVSSYNFLSQPKPKSKSKSNKNVSINEIENMTFQYIGNEHYDDLDEKEYMDYNQEFFNNLNDYYDISCIDSSDKFYERDEPNELEEFNKINEINEFDKSNNNFESKDIYSNLSNKNIYDNEPNEDNYEDDIIDELYEKMHESTQVKYNNNITDNELFQSLTNYNSGDNIFSLNKNNKFKKNNGFIDEKENYDNENNDDENKDDGYYFFNLLNIFMKYYNNKYDKLEHLFSNINDVNKDTSIQMELFFDAILEFKLYINQMELTSNEAMEQLYTESEPEKISNMFTKWDKQIYMFEFGELKLFSPCLIICLNYIFVSQILNEDWKIYNLRDN